jgi:hypothetical protein
LKVDLDQDRHGQHGDYERLSQDLLALEAEQQHECGRTAASRTSR